jgi:hypothetical protein
MDEIRSAVTEPSDATTKSTSTSDAVARPNDFTARPKPQYPIVAVSVEHQTKGKSFTCSLPFFADVRLATTASLVRGKPNKYKLEGTHIV